MRWISIPHSIPSVLATKDIMQTRSSRPNNKRPFVTRGTTHRKRNNAHLEERDDHDDRDDRVDRDDRDDRNATTRHEAARPAAAPTVTDAPSAPKGTETDAKYPRLELDSSKPIIT